MSMTTSVVGSDTFDMDAIGDRDAIVVPATFNPCHKITIWETEGTSEYDIGVSASVVDKAVTYPRGYPKVFYRSILQNPFEPGDILAYGSVPAGTVTFNILGEEEVLG